MKQALFIGAFASVLTINSVLADTTVTSKQYVDTTRQATIPATGTNASTPGTTVVTYTGTAGQIGERGICNDNPGQCMGGDLITNNLLRDFADYVGDQIQDAQNLPETTVTYKTCTEWITGQSHTDENCVLWNLSDRPVYGRCTTGNDCSSFDCSNSTFGDIPECDTLSGKCFCTIAH